MVVIVSLQNPPTEPNNAQRFETFKYFDIKWNL